MIGWTSAFAQPTAPPTITSFSPATVCQGGTVTITGTNFTGATRVQLGSMDAASFQVVDDNTIRAIVADNALSGTVSVSTPIVPTTTATGNLTVNEASIPALQDIGSPDPFSNCNGNNIYELRVRNISTIKGSNNTFSVDWGDGSPVFTQTDWTAGAQINHTYNALGYFQITITITGSNGCSRSRTYQFYNGKNPLASFTTSNPTTGLCAPAPVEFKIGDWFNNTPGTIYVIDFGDRTPNVTLTHPLNTTNTVHLISHTYNITSCPGSADFRATLRVINGCYTTTYTLDQILVRSKPIANFVTNADLCINEPVCFTNRTTSGYSGNSCNTASVYTWSFGDGTQSFDENPPCHTYANPGTYEVILTASNAACGADEFRRTITISPLSPPPATTPVFYCQNETPAPLSVTGTNIRWYTSATGGTGAATPPAVSTSSPGTYTFYVTQTLPNQCESIRVPLVITIRPRPAAPTVTTPVQLCLNQTATPLTATGSNLRWYTTSSGGTGSTTAPTPATNALGSTTYYVSQTVNGCEGPRAEIVVNVNALAVAPTVTSPVRYCQGSTASPLTASGTGLRWYTLSNGGTASTTAPVPSTTTPGSTTYYVSQTSGCGESPRTAITVDVTIRPNATISYAPSNLCNSAGSAAVLPTLTGNTGGIYTITPSGLPIDANTGELTPDGATPNTYTITYTTPASGPCPAVTTNTRVTVSDRPTATITYPAICTEQSTVAVQRSGATGGTFTAPPELTIDANTGTITPGTSTPGTYTVTYTIPAAPPCAGNTVTTSVTITQAPSATIRYNPAIFCNAGGSPVQVNRTGSANGVYSVTPAGLSVNASSGEIDPDGATPGDYTITYTVTGQGGCSDFSTTTRVSVNGTPDARITYPPVCSSDGPVSVTHTGSAGGRFTSTTGLTIDPVTGTITPGSSTPGNYTVTYNIAAAPPCAGFSTTANVVITRAPNATISYNPSSLCNVVNSPANPNPTVNVVRTGDAGGRYTISPATGLSIDAISGMITPSGATANTYTITYTLTGTGGCANFSTNTTVTISNAPSAGISYAGSPYCGSITTPQAVTFNGTPGGTYSATRAGLSINATTGAIIPASSTPGDYEIVYEILPSAPCPGTRATAHITIIESPVISFPTPQQTICSGGSASYVPTSTVANTNYTWSLSGTLPAGVSGITSGTSSGPINLSFTNTSGSDHALTIRVIPGNPLPGACSGAAYDLAVTVRAAVPPPLTETANFCMGTPAAALQVSPLPGNTIRWYDQHGTRLNAAPVIDPSNPGRHQYFVSQITAANCESPRAEIIAIVHPTAKIVSSSFSNPIACGIPSGNIVLHVLDLNNNLLPNTPVIIHYTQFQTPRTFIATADATGMITIPLTAGTYSNISVETVGGCTSQPIPHVFVLRDPTPPEQPRAGYNPPVCTGQEVRLTALTATSEQAGPIDYVWAGPAFGPYADTIRNSVVTFPEAQESFGGTYVVYAMQNNCISLPASFQLNVQQGPSKPVISTRTPLCVGDELTLQATSSITGNANLQYTWRGPGPGFPINGPNASIRDVRVEHTGIYTITVTAPQTGCTVSTDTLIQVGDYPVVRFAQDTMIAPTGYKLQLVPQITNANSPGVSPIEHFTWTPNQQLNYQDAIHSSAIAEIKNDICYTVTATNIFGCSGSDDICIRVFCERSQVFVPNAFAPKGNVPENRKLVVRATGISSVKSFRVFNRWGRIVYERSNFPPNSTDFGWDGMINGRMADTGVYVYTVDVICENGVPYTFKGNVTLL